VIRKGEVRSRDRKKEKEKMSGWMEINGWIMG
jgi:hypothetical protein